ncbi:MAG: hypothetical protein GY739_12060, partial [Mesoflavibacter sp.]|nr:hypothetical protein [Mesoflavibacter sp.]
YRNAIQYLEVDSEIMEVYTVTSDVISLEEAIENDFAVDVAPKKKDLTKDGFNPSQPRDSAGMWTDAGYINDNESNTDYLDSPYKYGSTVRQTRDRWVDTALEHALGRNAYDIRNEVTIEDIDKAILGVQEALDSRLEMPDYFKDEIGVFKEVLKELERLKKTKKSLIKAGFNPNQPRNPDGTWGSGGSVNTDYRGSHQIWYDEDYNSTLDDLTKGGELIPNDIFEHPEWYANMNNKASQESWKAILSAQGKPNIMIKIYRGVPKGVAKINSGDWITLSPTYALQHSWDMHGAGKDGDVIEM